MRTTVVIIVFLFLAVACENKSNEYISSHFSPDSSTSIYFVTKGQGKPIIIVHGGPGFSHTYMESGWNALAKDFQLIYYDQRACGLSTGNSDSASISMDVFVNDLFKLQNQLNLQKVYIAGHSFGSLIAFNYAAKHPERIEKLILVAPPGPDWNSIEEFTVNRENRMPELEKAYQDSILALNTIAEGDSLALEKYLRSLLKVYFFQQALVSKPDLLFTSNTAINLFQTSHWMFKDIYHYDYAKLATEIIPPVLIIAGENDLIPVSASKKWNKLLPRSKLIVYKNCGHFPSIDQPLRFIKDINVSLND